MSDKKMYILLDSENYADEFDYGLCSFVSPEMRGLLLMHGVNALPDWNDSFYFGTNESLEISRDSFLRRLRNADEFDQKDFEFSKNILSKIPSLDIVGNVIDRIIEHLEDSKDTILLPKIMEIQQQDRGT